MRTDSIFPTNKTYFDVQQTPRLLITLNQEFFDSGITGGDVIRYDTLTAKYKKSIADSSANSEVFGIVESIRDDGSALVVINGCINYPSAKLVNKSVDAGSYTNDGLNDIYFLSGYTAGLLENIITPEMAVAKPIFQKIPHDPYTGVVRNYLGYRNINFETSSFGSYAVSNDDNKRMYAYITMGIPGSSNPNWLDWGDTEIATFQGDPYPSGTRAYPWEANPANPDISSPWHNVIYENCIDIYNWGARAFYLYCPFGSFDLTFFLTPEILKRTLTTTGGPNYQVPARWKGRRQAIKALLDGNLRPTGKVPMDEPCNVFIYHPTNRGYTLYRSRSNTLWDSFSGTNDQKDTAYYDYLDSHINELIGMKGDTPPAGKLSIIFDATGSTNNATPDTIHLFRSTSGYRSDKLELSDWYVYNRLRAANIDVYIEARPKKSITTANPGGTPGSSVITQWGTVAFCAEEYNIWYQNPSNTDTGFDDYAEDSSVPAIMRVVGSNWPIPANGDPNRDPFHPNLKVVYGGETKTLQYGPNYFYTPHRAVWNIYALSDNYRKYYNKKNNTDLMQGNKLSAENSIVYVPEQLIDGPICISAYVGGGVDPELNYWRLNGKIVDSRPPFGATGFTANPSTYGSVLTQGFWTPAGITYWDDTVRQTSFSDFITYLENYSLSIAPKNTPAWLGVTYGGLNDPLSVNTIQLV